MYYRFGKCRIIYYFLESRIFSYTWPMIVTPKSIYCVLEGEDFKIRNTIFAVTREARVKGKQSALKLSPVGRGLVLGWATTFKQKPL